MLIEFSVGNYLSFNEKVTFSMEATRIKELEEENVIEVNKRLNLLKSAVLYGANASGKSNLIKAMGFMRGFVINSSKESQAGEEIDVERFRLNSATEDKPSFFEILIMIDDVRYRYGFEVDKKEIKSEWLFRASKIKEIPLFVREKGDIHITKDFPEGRGLNNRTRENALFLSVSAQFNGAISEKIISWFQNVNFISGLSNKGYEHVSLSMLEDEKMKNLISRFISQIDVNIEGLEVKKKDVNIQNLFPSGISAEIKNEFLKKTGNDRFVSTVTILTKHKKYNEKNEVTGIEFLDFETEESEGTKKFFGLIGPIIDTLLYKRVLIIDEIEAKLHPNLFNSLINLFNSLNKKGAQFIFATHHPTLLKSGLLRRDQIWFTEKDNYEATKLFSLVEYKTPESESKIRNDASYEKDYLIGRYGAVPFLRNFDDEVGRLLWEGK